MTPTKSGCADELRVPRTGCRRAGQWHPARVSQPDRMGAPRAGGELRRARGRVVTDYGDPVREATACAHTVGVADVSHLGKLELQAEVGVASAIVAELTDGGALAPGQ